MVQVCHCFFGMWVFPLFRWSWVHSTWYFRHLAGTVFNQIILSGAGLFGSGNPKCSEGPCDSLTALSGFAIFFGSIQWLHYDVLRLMQRGRTLKLDAAMTSWDRLCMVHRAGASEQLCCRSFEIWLVHPQSQMVLLSHFGTFHVYSWCTGVGQEGLTTTASQTFW